MPKGRILGFQGQRAALHFSWWIVHCFSAPAGGRWNHGYPSVHTFCPLPFLGWWERGSGEWEWGSDPSAAASSQLRGLELAPVALAPVFSLSEGSMRPRSWVQAPAGAPCPAPLAPSEAAACWDWAHCAALLPQVLLLSSGLLSAQVTSFHVGEPAHGRGATLLLGRAEVPLTRVPPHVGTASLCLSQVFASLTLGTQSAVGGWTASLSLDTCTLPPAVWVV